MDGSALVITTIGILGSFVSILIAYGTLKNSTSQTQFQWLTGELGLVKEELEKCREREKAHQRSIRRLIAILTKAGLTIPDTLLDEEDAVDESS